MYWSYGMNAVIDLGGKQISVTKKEIIAVDKLDDSKKTVEFDKVMLVSDGKEVTIGKPYISGATVKAKILDNVRDKKVDVFKFKRRKNYKRMKGHKQPYTVIEIQDIKAG
jgi:large subunit ribosomal protein L21